MIPTIPLNSRHTFIQYKKSIATGVKIEFCKCFMRCFHRMVYYEENLTGCITVQQHAYSTQCYSCLSSCLINLSIHIFRDGAGNQCCYSETGSLVFAADTFQGSTPDKSHDWGAAPYMRPGYVPSLSHWIRDVVTFYYCCLWNEYGSCDHYMDLRPTKDCTGYNPPVLGTFNLVFCAMMFYAFWFIFLDQVTLN